MINNDVTTAMWLGAMMEVLIDSLANTIIGIATDIGVDVLVDVNTNVLAGVMTTLELAISQSFKEFSCCAAFDC